MTIADLKRISVVIPDKNIQDKIVFIVKMIDDKIEVNNEINKNLPPHCRQKIDDFPACGGNEETPQAFSSLWAA